MKKIKQIAPWLMLALYFLVLLPLVGAKKKDIACESINVAISDNTNNYFVQEADVLSMLDDKGILLKGYAIDSINRDRLEELLLQHPSVKNAEVYGTLNGELNIAIEQRNPILRVINSFGESYYIDEEGALMPMSSKYSAHVLVANGQVPFTYTQRQKDGLKIVNEDFTDNKDVLSELYTLARFIYADDFWKAQIEQIYVKHVEYELVPRVGAHIVEFGGIEEYPQKFRKLKALYTQGMPKTGWNKYDKVNLKYSNQVICTKR
jgi:cell division protein FtsQ